MTSKVSLLPNFFLCQILAVVRAFRVADIVQGIDESSGVVLDQCNAKLENRVWRSGGGQRITERNNRASLMELQVTL